MKRLAVLSALVYALDLLSKWAIRTKLPFGAEIGISPFLSIVHINNTGIAFGLFQNQNLVFLVIGLLMVAGMFFLARKLLPEDKWGAYLIAIILGGALGNLTDRFLYGRVTDFLDFYWGVHHWPAFNVADSAICVGATLLILRELLRKKHVSNPV